MNHSRKCYSAPAYLAIGLSLLLIGQLLARGYFFWRNKLALPPIGLEQLSETLWWSLRVDLTAVLLLNLPVIVYFLLPRSLIPSALSFLVGCFFAVANAISLAVVLGDAELFAFAGKRVSRGTFAIVADLQDQFSQLLGFYWYIVLGTSVVAGFVYWLLWIALLQRTSYLRLVDRIILLILVTLGIRGGLQAKPLGPAHVAALGAPVSTLVSQSKFYAPTRSRNSSTR